MLSYLVISNDSRDHSETTVSNHEVKITVEFDLNRNNIISNKWVATNVCKLGSCLFLDRKINIFLNSIEICNEN